MSSNYTDSVSSPTGAIPASSSPKGGPSSPGDHEGPVKRKRVAIACDNCHSDKRRCDGTGPCSHCYYGQRTCVYKDRSGNRIEPPVKTHDILQEIIVSVDLSQSPDALLTYRTASNAEDHVARHSHPTDRRHR
ncbi:hypothetical protein QCA50_010731 [Cerrena zonata]|uniref:Zn(2)-C6 fungal-type domain-containing protein n=1 Tax=Cerrena zonata TaxID=2478898 RepID=A0AAW0G332_9APHY